jgi:glycerophosphoryl diester phosphodiesterase
MRSGQTRSVPKLFAHRGVHTSHRTNSIPAFERAVELGADGVELDVHLTKDGVLVVHHDFVLADDGPLDTLLSGSLPPYVPTLEEAFSACSDLVVNVEIKYDAEKARVRRDDLAASVIEEIERLGREETVIISSFDSTVLASCRRFRDSIDLGLLCRWDQPFSEHLGVAERLGLQAVHPFFFVTAIDDVDRAHRAGLLVNVWTVNDESSITDSAEMGVDGIITDALELAQEICRSLPTM